MLIWIERVCLLALAAGLLPGCALRDEMRFPLDITWGLRQGAQVETAREALAGYERMGPDLERSGRVGDAALAYIIASSLARNLGLLQKSLDLGVKALALAERTEKPMLIALAVERIALVLSPLNRREEAIRFYERSLEIYQRMHLEIGIGNCLCRLSGLHRALGHQVQALELAKAAVEILTNDLTSLASRARDEQLRALLEYREGTFTSCLMDLGWLYANGGEWGSAEETFTKALAMGAKLGNQRILAYAYRGLGATARQRGQLTAAANYLEEGLRISRWQDETVALQRELGRVYFALGRPAESEEILRQAIATSEEQRSLLRSEDIRESFLENKIRPYRDLMVALLAQDKIAEAFDVSERARARAFLDLLGSRVNLSRVPSFISEEQSLQQRIALLKALPDDSSALRRELSLARDAYLAFLNRVRESDREQTSLMSVEPLTLTQVQDLLPDGSVLLEYFVAGDRTFVWTVDKQSVTAARINLSERSVIAIVDAFRATIASQAAAEQVTALAQNLFNELVRPALQDRHPKELLIVPHNVLHYLPFHALMPAPGRYLIQGVPITYFSSASLIQFTRAKVREVDRSVMAVGNPDLQDPRLNLRFAEREVREITSLFPRSAVFTRSDATRENVMGQLSHHAILHFATHAELDENDPLGSSLLLAPTSKNSGRLEVREVFGLRLDATLVVLSACETHLGTLNRGDELTGLTRAFIYAGTPSIITTLWQVNDWMSYDLVRQFYRNLAGGLDKAEALRQAQVSTIEKGRHPYFWAAYQLTGERRW
jgi:CHAT domain-containing protein